MLAEGAAKRKELWVMGQIPDRRPNRAEFEERALVLSLATDRQQIDMLHPFVLGLAALMAYGQSTHAEPCKEIHGRAIYYSGDSFLEIWHVGTNHTFFVVDEKSSDLILDQLHYKVDSPEQALFADFTVCPTEKFKKGASQPVIVKRIRNPRLVKR